MLLTLIKGNIFLFYKNLFSHTLLIIVIEFFNYRKIRNYNIALTVY